MGLGAFTGVLEDWGCLGCPKISKLTPDPFKVITTIQKTHRFEDFFHATPSKPLVKCDVSGLLLSSTRFRLTTSSVTSRKDNAHTHTQKPGRFRLAVWRIPPQNCHSMFRLSPFGTGIGPRPSGTVASTLPRS